MRYTYSITIAEHKGKPHQSYSGHCLSYEVTSTVIFLRHDVADITVYGLAHIVSFAIKPTNAL